MKIAYIFSSLVNGGPIVVAFDLVKLMMAHGHQVEVFYFDDRVELPFPCKTTRISMTTPMDFTRFDVIHTHGVRPDLYVLLHKPLFGKTPTCTTIHGYRNAEHGFKAKMQSNIGLLATMRDDQVILLSKHMQNFYGKYLPKGKLTYAYNSRRVDWTQDLDEEEKRQVLHFKGEDTMLCSVSGLNQRKALWQVIEALTGLERVKYCVVGDGLEKAALERLAKEKGVDDRVLFVGRKPNGSRYLKYADVFVMPSYSEGFPLAMLEATSLGKAVVCSRLPVYDELFTDDEIVRFDVEDIAGLRDAIRRAIRENDRLAKNVHDKFLRAYSPEQCYKRHIEIYNELIERKHGKG